MPYRTNAVSSDYLPLEAPLKEFYTINMFLGLLGIGLALVAWACAASHAHDPQDTMFFGTKLPMAVFGMIGYLMITLSAALTLWMNSVGTREAIVLAHAGGFAHVCMIFFAGAFTLYLVWKAVSVSLACPGCWLCWLLNGFLAIHTIKYLRQK